MFSLAQSFIKKCHGHVLEFFLSLMEKIILCIRVAEIFEMFSLSLQHCAYCKRLGASVKCCAEGCAQLYHFPCAGAAGTFQDIRSLSLLCPEHIELAIHKCK